MKSAPKHRTSTQMDRFNYIIDDNVKLAIPIGPRFQADVPNWTSLQYKDNCSHIEPDCSKWLGTVIWSRKDATPEIEGCFIGKGRPESCDCTTPFSTLCVTRHISEKTSHLKAILGPAFLKWKFDQMGEAVAKSWKLSEQLRLTHLMESNSSSEGQDFIKRALECFPLKSKKDIVRFYFNVYIPRRMSIQTRSECTMVNTDDEEEKSTGLFKGSRKKARVDCLTVYGPKLVNAKYLIGRR